MNNYMRDAGEFLRRAARLFEPDVRDQMLVDALWLTALGLERVLKGILHDINPIYVFKNQDFKHSVQTLYSRRILAEAGRSEELAANPDRDVLSFRTSLLRAALVSQVTLKHKALLFALSAHRDVIAHCDLDLLDRKSASLLLLRDVAPLLKEYATELGVPMTHFVAGLELRLLALAAEHQEDIATRVRMKLDGHARRWEQLRNVPGYSEKMRVKTANTNRVRHWDVLECPACHNEALVEVEADYVYEKEIDEAVFMGVFVKQLRCLYCKLAIKDYREIDHLRLNQLYNQTIVEEGPEGDVST